MVRKLKGFRSLWIVAALAAALTIAGCSDNSPLSPDPGQGSEFGKLSLYDAKSEAEPVVADVSQTINAIDGGVIAIPSGSYNHSFEVPKDAIDSDVTISASVEKILIGRDVAVVFEFGPDGLVFNSPSKLKFDVGDLSSRDGVYNFYYFDPAVNAWVLQGSNSVDRGYVEFDVSHFSKYAISD